MGITKMEAFSQIGVYFQIYATLHILSQTSSMTFTKNDYWNTLIRQQVYKHDNHQIDIHSAYDLLESQDYLCKKCQRHLSKETEPILHKNIYLYHFLGHTSKSFQYHWFCKTCLSNSPTKEDELNDKIAKLIEEEENE